MSEIKIEEKGKIVGKVYLNETSAMLYVPEEVFGNPFEKAYLIKQTPGYKGQYVIRDLTSVNGGVTDVLVVNYNGPDVTNVAYHPENLTESGDPQKQQKLLVETLKRMKAPIYFDQINEFLDGKK